MTATLVVMQQSGRYTEELASFTTRGRASSAEDPVAAAVAASGALFELASRTAAEVLEVVTMPQYLAMATLAPEPLLMAELAERVGLAREALDHALSALVQDGLAEERSNGTIALTAHGLQLVVHVSARREAELSLILSTLPRADRRAVASGFQIFSEAMADDNTNANPNASS